MNYSAPRIKREKHDSESEVNQMIRACASNLYFYHKHSQTDSNRSDKVKGAESQGGVGAPKFSRLMEGPDQRKPKLMPAASMGMQRFPKFPMLIEGPDQRIPTKLMALI